MRGTSLILKQTLKHTGPMTTPITVAIVEDDSDTRSGIARSILADAELELTDEFRNGGEALAGLADRVPEVLLVDLGLPDMSGLDLIRIAARHHPDCEILVFTAFADESHVLSALEAGARGYLLKGSLQHDIGLDIRDIKAGGSPLSPVIARHLLRRMETPPQGSKSTHHSATNSSSSSLNTPAGTAGTEQQLSPREREILNAISRGFTYAETAKLMGIGPATVHTHLKHVYRKLAVSSKTEAIFEASRMGLL